MAEVKPRCGWCKKPVETDIIVVVLANGIGRPFHRECEGKRGDKAEGPSEGRAEADPREPAAAEEAKQISERADRIRRSHLQLKVGGLGLEPSAD